MKKILCAMMLVCVMASCSWGDVEINAANFPDDAFRDYVSSNFDTESKDNALSDAEISAVTRIEAYSRGISSLKGIEYFTGLAYLDCSDNNLSELDISANTALTSLNCQYNSLASLDVGSSRALETLYCSYNQLAGLDVSHNTYLKILDCQYNQLASLDLSSNTALQQLSCAFNQITALDLRNCTALTNLGCSYNRIASLDVSGCPSLSMLQCRSNDLTELNVRSNTGLVTLSCQDNYLTELDLGENYSLEELYCTGNLLYALEVSNLPSLRILRCGDNMLTSLDVRENAALEILSFGNTETDTKINDGNQLTEIDVTANKSLVEITGTNNQITAIDVSQNEKLELFSMIMNQLTSVDLGNNHALKRVYLGGNKITELDISGHEALTYLSCESNQLSRLDVSGCTELAYLYCWANELRTLDLDSNTKLEILRCDQNHLAALDLSRNLSLDVEASALRFNIKGQRVPEINIVRSAASSDNGDSAYPYMLVFSEYMDVGNISRIDASSIKASDENVESVDVSYANGIARFSAIPEVVSYTYSTGLDGATMDVKIGEGSYLTVTLNGHVYRLFTRGDTWDNAEEYCRSVSGHLATVTSDDEFLLLTALVDKAQSENDTFTDSYWLGGRYVRLNSEESGWRWVTSEDFSFSSVISDDGTYLALSHDVFVGKHSYRALPFICEWEPTAAAFKSDVDPMYQLWSDDPKAYFSGDVSYGENPSPVNLTHLTANPPERDRAADYNPPLYDPRSKTILPSVKEQQYGTCWSFASIGALESSYAMQFETQAPDLSELHQAWYAYMNPVQSRRFERRDVESGEDPVLDQGGDYLMSIYFLSSVGTAAESDLPFTQSSVAALRSRTIIKSPDQYAHPMILREAYTLGVINADNREDVKYLAKKYGSVRVGIFYANSGYHENNASYYLPDTNRTNHAVQLVGWDDNYSRDNFRNRPGQNGAWLMKNSWGDDWGRGGYFWVSYEQFIAGSAVYIADRTSAGTVYGRGSTNPSYCLQRWSWAANMFHSTGADSIKEVAFYTRDNNVPYEIYIIKHGTTKPANPGTPGTALLSGTMDYAGYHTVVLDEYVPIDPGEYFSVIVKLGAGSNYGVVHALEKNDTASNGEITTAGKSYFSQASDKPTVSQWADAAGFSGGVYNASIRAFTASTVTSAFDAPTITTNRLSSGTVGRAYAQRLSATSSMSVTWYATGLPVGISVEGDRLTGTPIRAGTYSVEIVADSSAGANRKTLELVINSAPDDPDDNPENPIIPVNPENPGSPGTSGGSGGGGGCNASSMAAMFGALAVIFTVSRKK